MTTFKDLVRDAILCHVAEHEEKAGKAESEAERVLQRSIAGVLKRAVSDDILDEEVF